MSERSAETMLGVLASLRHLVQYRGRFHLTDSTREFLLPDSPFYVGALLDFRRNRVVNHKVVKNVFFQDEPAFTHELDPDQWVSEPSPEQLKAFTATMHSVMFPSAMGWL